MRTCSGRRRLEARSSVRWASVLAPLVASILVVALAVVLAHQPRATFSEQPGRHAAAATCRAHTLRARALATPTPRSRCEAEWRVVAFGGRIAVTLPQGRGRRCSRWVSGHAVRYTLCVIVDGGYFYASTRMVRLPLACASPQRPIRARLLRIPVSRFACDLDKRLVIAMVGRVHVGAYLLPTSEPGSICNSALGTDGETMLCVYTNAFGYYASVTR